MVLMLCSRLDKEFVYIPPSSSGFTRPASRWPLAVIGVDGKDAARSVARRAIVVVAPVS